METQFFNKMNLKRIAIGVIVMLFGGVLLLKNMDMLDPFWSNVIFSWPMILIAIGTVNVFGKKPWFGVVLLAVGLFFITPKFIVYDFNVVKLFWPVVILVIGTFLVIAGLKRNHKEDYLMRDRAETNEDYIDEVAIFGGVERKVYSQNLKGGKITSIFGGSEIDFTQAKLSNEKNIIDVTTIFGGTELRIPADWNVKVEVVAIFGGFEDKSHVKHDLIDTSKTVIIKGIALFGGGEIKRY